MVEECGGGKEVGDNGMERIENFKEFSNLGDASVEAEGLGQEDWWAKPCCWISVNERG